MGGNELYAGVDLGGTKIAAILMESDSDHTLHQRTLPTLAHEGPEAVLARIAQAVDDMRRDEGIARNRVRAVGLGVPSVVDYSGGRTVLLPNMPGDWNGRPVAAQLSALTGCPVYLVNDARAFALAEATLGAGRGAHQIAFFTVGTGIGGGLVLGGQLYLGAEGRAGEFGHQTVEPDGPRCGCGNSGCLEALASGPAISAAGVRVVMQGIDSAIGRLVGQDIRQITPAVIKQAAEMGDQHARGILYRAGSYLGIGFSNVITLFSPDRVIVGGGVAELGDWILEPARAMVQKRCHTAPLAPQQIVRAALGGYAGAMGAAVWCKQQVSAARV